VEDKFRWVKEYQKLKKKFKLVSSIASHHAWYINQSVAAFRDIFKVVGLDFLKKIIFNNFLLQIQSVLY